MDFQEIEVLGKRVVAGFLDSCCGEIKPSKESRKRVDVAGLSDPGGQGAPHYVFKWILRGHFKPTPNATI